MIRDHQPGAPALPGFPIALVALDIDGTLVGHDLRLSPRTIAAVREAVRRGVRVSLATGRMPSSAMAFANQLGLRSPVIGHQGAVIRAAPSRPELPRSVTPGSRGRVGRLLYHQPLAADVVLEAVDWCRANGLDPHINDLERMVIWADDPSFEDYSTYVGRDAIVVHDLRAEIRRPMTKVIAVGEAGRPMALVEEARRVFAGRADPTVSHPRFLEFVAPGVSKGRAVAWLAWRAGIPMTQVLAAGDALNDLEMVASAGHGIAMPTAPDALRAAARYVARPVGEDGVAELLEALVLAGPEEAARNATRLAAEKLSEESPDAAPEESPDAAPEEAAAR